MPIVERSSPFFLKKNDELMSFRFALFKKRDSFLTVHRFRIGVLTSGGDCPGLNAVIRAAVASAHTLGWEVLGFIDGYEGLLSPVNYKILADARVTAASERRPSAPELDLRSS